MVTMLPYVYDVQLLPDLSQRVVRLQHQVAASREATVVEWHVAHKKILLRFDNCQDMETAAQWRGYEVHIPRQWFAPLPEGEYYWFDIEGLAVHAYDGAYLGKITQILYTGSNDVYVVQDGERETLIPALKAVVRAIDLKDGVMHLFPSTGLWE
jgi:16S rRNA processing protein RimM